MKNDTNMEVDAQENVFQDTGTDEQDVEHSK